MKKLYLKLLLLSLIVIPIYAYADTGSLSTSCSPATAKPGSTISCTLTATTDVKVTSVGANVELGNGATVTQFQLVDPWQGGSDAYSDGTIGTYVVDGKSGTFTIGTFSIKINDNASNGTINLGFSDIAFSNESGIEFAGTSTNTSITVSEAETPVVTEKGLKTLDCTSGGTLSPQLSANNQSYLIMLDSPGTSTFSISATPKNSSDSITYQYINGSATESISNPTNITFKTSGGQSSMLILMHVGSGDNALVYDITITKPVSEKGKLATLTVGGKSVTISSNKYDYQVTLDSVNSYQINATVTDSNKFEVFSPNVGRSLSGEGTYEIVVRPVDSTSGYESATYIVAVSKTGSTKTPVPTTRPTPSGNPQTGEGGIVIIGLALMISLMITIYLYKRNAEYNN